MNNVAFIKKSVLMLILTLAGSVSGIQAQSAVAGHSYTEADKQLWGTWELQSVKQRTFINSEVARTRDYQKSDLIKRNAQIPEDVFVLLYFFDNKVGICATRKESSPDLEFNEKGQFLTIDNNLIITINKMTKTSEMRQVTYDLVYSIDGDKLFISYDLPDAGNTDLSYKYDVIFTLTHRD